MGLATPGGAAGFAADVALCGRMTLRRCYDQGAGALPATYAASACAQDWSMGVYSAYSVPLDGATAQAVANGAYDTRLRTWWRSVPSGSHVYFAMAHEADVKINQQLVGTYTADQYNAAYQRMAALLVAERAAGNPQAVSQITLTACLTGYYWRTLGGIATTLDAGLLAADLVAADAYGKGQYSPIVVQQAYSDWCDANGKAKAIWEFGTTSAQPGGKGQWIKDFSAYAFNNGYDHIAGFDSAVGGSEPFLQGEGLPAWQYLLGLYQAQPPGPVVVPSPISRGNALRGRYRVLHP